MSSLDNTYELDEKQKAFRALMITLFTITGAFIAMRCWVRVRLQAQFTADDYLLVTALAIYAIQTAFGIYAIDHGGFGGAIASVPPAIYAVGLKWIILTQITYPLVQLFAKLSIALLQLRIGGLSTSPLLRRTHYASMALVVLVSLLGFFSALIQCDPGNADALSSQSQVPGPRHRQRNGGILIPTVPCHSHRPTLIAGYVVSALSIALDWYYSVAMAPCIWALRNVSAVVRLGIIVVLGMGVLASVATVVKLVYLLDGDYDTNSGSGDSQDDEAEMKG
ncbi:putative integral membrane family protein [Diplodia seriata]|uniref:Putative integral membrane family protein n=1 Tax=Diplodia seriata TaxID=420778 RepID=A0A0G2EYA6_9PEZI|nr:putative integral membrane family protein [Diplodia seriata]